MDPVMVSAGNELSGVRYVPHYRRPCFPSAHPDGRFINVTPNWATGSSGDGITPLFL